MHGLKVLVQYCVHWQKQPLVGLRRQPRKKDTEFDKKYCTQ